LRPEKETVLLGNAAVTFISTLYNQDFEAMEHIAERLTEAEEV